MGHLPLMGRSGTRPIGDSSEAVVGRRPTHAFTLVELLVCIAVVAVLLSLFIPALKGVKENARWALSYANQRQLMTGLSLYAKDSREKFPYVQKAGKPDARVIQLPQGPLRGVSYFGAGCSFWVNVVVPTYLPGFERVVDPSFREPSENRTLWPRDTLFSYFNMTYTAFAAPRYWSGDEVPTDRWLYRATTVAEVEFPANKGLLIDTTRPPFRAPTAGPSSGNMASIGMADGSARGRTYPPEGWEERIVARPYGAMTKQWPVMCTREGLRGIDF